jgi:2-dehydro-3-deoxyglucarate aldolase/4-hydroxy-2-oxoheptanedioate aldolase
MDLKRALAERDPVEATWVSVPHPAVAELAAEQGFDCVFLDAEHTPASVETVESLVRAVDAGSDGTAASIVRVPWNDPVRLKRALDTGPTGVMVPMVETREAAEAFVEATRYPPDGVRGMAAARASGYGTRFAEYVETANESVVTIAQVETERGVENAGDIAAVDGLDALFVGPADLGASLGSAPGEERFEDAVASVVAAAHDAGVPVGTLATSTDGIDGWVERGVDFLAVGYDLQYLAEGAARARTAYESARER